MKTQTNTIMKTTFRMKEATNKEEAIISILDVLEHNPLWLNKCTSDLFAIVKRIYELNDNKDKIEIQCDIFNCMPKEQIVKLFQEIKTEYYYFKDITQYNY